MSSLTNLLSKQAKSEDLLEAHYGFVTDAGLDVKAQEVRLDRSVVQGVPATGVVEEVKEVLLRHGEVTHLKVRTSRRL